MEEVFTLRILISVQQLIRPPTMLTVALISFLYATIVRGVAIGGAGYDTSRVGPSNAICKRQLYNVTVSANNTVFASLSNSANEVGSHPGALAL